MAASGSIEDFVATTTLKSSFVTSISNYSAEEDVSEFSNASSFNHKVRLTTVSDSVYTSYVFIAALIIYLSLVLNAIVVAFYRKPQTCNRIFVFAMACKDFASLIFTVLPLFFPSSVLFYNSDKCSSFVITVFEFYPCFFLIVNQFCQTYLPLHVSLFNRFKYVFLAVHVFEFGLYFFSKSLGLTSKSANSFRVLAFSMWFTMLFATLFMIFVFEYQFTMSTNKKTTSNPDPLESQE